ncbi:hypothetical protein D7231_35560, partial [Streptomyces klenkii]
MSEPLPRRVAVAFESAVGLLERGGEDTELLRRALAAERDRAGRTMSVAVVGRISTGKSTLVNALIGEERLATGSQELTYNVNRLRHGPEARLLVHYKDGRPPRPFDPGQLTELTVRRERRPEEIDGIAEIVVELPSPYLRAFELIDTPGLDSVFGQDSLNTLEFLGLDPGEVRSATLRHAASADGLVFVVPVRGPSAGDSRLLAQYLGPEFVAATPLTALGVLTKCEQEWEAGGPHPLDLGR